MSTVPHSDAASTPKFCSQCASLLKPGARFCTKCGATVGAVSSQPSARSAAPSDVSTVRDTLGWNIGAWLLPAPWLLRHGKRGFGVLYTVLAVPIVFCLVALANWARILFSYWPVDAATAERERQMYGYNFGLTAMSVAQFLIFWHIIYLILSLPVGLKANRWASSDQTDSGDASSGKRVIVGAAFALLSMGFAIFMSYRSYAAHETLSRFLSLQ